MQSACLCVCLSACLSATSISVNRWTDIHEILYADPVAVARSSWWHCDTGAEYDVYECLVHSAMILVVTIYFWIVMFNRYVVNVQ